MKKIVFLTILFLLCLSMLTAQDFNFRMQSALNSLASNLNSQLQVSISPITMSGTDAPSELSRFLNNLLVYHVEDSGRFNVVQPAGGSEVFRPSVALSGNITGTFNSMGDLINVFLYLVVGGERIASSHFYIEAADLRYIGIAVEPENQNALVERERLFTELARPVQASPTASQENIRIHARFNSDTRTYLHSDELQIWLTSDRNCYFKVIHIDANNEQTMIYPSREETDNRLYANTERPVFQKIPYILYPPYGAETILIVASPVQFQNIERDYLTQSVPVSVDSIREAVTGNRGGQRESIRPLGFSGTGEARYNITLLKPHEEYIEPAPDSIAEEIAILKKDVEDQDGEFHGNERSGYFIVDGVRVSYRALPIVNPQDIEYAFYYENIWSGYIYTSMREVTFALERERIMGYTSESPRLTPLSESPPPAAPVAVPLSGSSTRKPYLFNFDVEVRDRLYSLESLHKMTRENKGDSDRTLPTGNFHASFDLGNKIAGWYETMTSGFEVFITQKPWAKTKEQIIEMVRDAFK